MMDGSRQPPAIRGEAWKQQEDGSDETSVPATITAVLFGDADGKPVAVGLRMLLGTEHVTIKLEPHVAIDLGAQLAGGARSIIYKDPILIESDARL